MYRADQAIDKQQQWHPEGKQCQRTETENGYTLHVPYIVSDDGPKPKVLMRIANATAAVKAVANMEG